MVCSVACVGNQCPTDGDLPLTVYDRDAWKGLLIRGLVIGCLLSRYWHWFASRYQIFKYVGLFTQTFAFPFHKEFIVFSSHASR